MTQKMLKFQTEDEVINGKAFPFEGSLHIKEMLLSFLSQTNSKTTLDSSQISFMFLGHMLNSDKYLVKTVNQVFKNSKNAIIRVTDTGNVIGGNEIFKIFMRQ